MKKTLADKVFEVRESKKFDSLSARDRSFIGYLMEYMDGYYDKSDPKSLREIKLIDLISWEEIQRLQAIYTEVFGDTEAEVA